MATFPTDYWQWASRWLRALSPRTKLAMALCTVCLLAAVILVSRFRPPAAYVTILAGRDLNEAELLAIEGAFAASNLSDYRLEGRAVRVPIVDRARYLQALTDANAMPRSFYGLAHDAFSESTPIEPSSQRAERLGQAREMQTALAIRQIPLIQDAFVRFDETPARGFRETTQATALVSVLTSDGHPLTAELRATIRDITLGLKAGLTADHITITDLQSGLAYRGGIADEMDEVTAAVAQYRRRLQQEWNERIANVLGFVPDVRIAVAVDLPVDPRQAASERHTEPVADPGDPSLQDAAGSRSATRLTASTPATLAAKTPEALGDAGGSRSYRLLQGIPFGQERTAISIGVPTSYLRQIWSGRRQAAARPADHMVPPEELAQIEVEVRHKIYQAIAPLLNRALRDQATPPGSAPDRRNHAHDSTPGGPPEAVRVDPQVGSITVTTFDDFASPPVVADLRARVDHWLQQYPFLIYLSPLAAALLVCWILCRTDRSADSPQAVPQALRIAAETLESSSASRMDELRHRLQAAVERDPRIAAETLAEWIKKTG
jgi:flagellar biosynthesis/type III secretory pathway M-ring protein FliF/YscJ